jgi:hypothetical protein
MRTSILSFALLAAWPFAARAEVYCVGTPVQLKDAFSNAASSPEASEIRVKTGFYALTPTGGNVYVMQTASASDLKMSGGWTDANCTPGSQDLDPEGTVLSAGFSGGLLRFFLLSGAATQIEISNLSLRQSSICLEIESGVGSDATVRIERNAFRLCQVNPGNGSALRVNARSADVYLRNNVFVDNSSTSGVVRLSGLGNSIFYVSNNTVANNPQPGGGGGPGGMQLSAMASDIFFLMNNVLWNNGTGNGYDLLATVNTPILLNGNLIGERAPLPAGAAELNALLGVDPRFVSSNDLRPRRDSPLRNSGVNPTGSALEIDFIGDSRVQGTRIDRGAHEYAEVFASGFE